MLKGDAFSCAYWPDESVKCSTTNETFAEPCRAPKTVDTELSTCEHTLARDLKSESHMLGWAIILGSFNILDLKKHSIFRLRVDCTDRRSVIADR